MATYEAEVKWRRAADERFIDQKYSRAHDWLFDGGARVRGSASPHSVRPPFSDPSAVDPEEAAEALQMVARDLTVGARKHLLQNQIVIVAPVFNVDGTDTFQPQDGSLGSETPHIFGTRENSQGLDLNRDAVKLETVEVSGMYQTREFPAGSFLVDMAQPMANAAFYYLEPQARDGFVGWHVLDDALRPLTANGRPAGYPIFKMRRIVN
jgi:hypothetical protein